MNQTFEQAPSQGDMGAYDNYGVAPPQDPFYQNGSYPGGPSAQYGGLPDSYSSGYGGYEGARKLETEYEKWHEVQGDFAVPFCHDLKAN
jgi:hypothetical protein